MSILDRLFKGRGTQSESRKPRAMAFVDYEHWFYSYKNLIFMKPDPASWRKELEQTYDIDDIVVFADFSAGAIREEVPKLREITNTIIETQNVNGRRKKDMTDFIMLDYLYQTAATKPELDTFIIFTGDGHFQSVVKYLVQRLQKKVIVYGVEGATSNQLKAVATATYELPGEGMKDLPIQKMIVENMNYVFSHPDIIPTFMGTVGAIVRKYDVPEYRVKMVLQDMLDHGLLVRKERRVDFNRKVSVITADWEKLAEAGMWSFT